MVCRDNITGRATYEAVWFQVVFGYVDSHRIYMHLFYLFFVSMTRSISYYDRTKLKEEWGEREAQARSQFVPHASRATSHGFVTM